MDDHFGRRIPDPYRALEDPDGEETKAFVDAQNSVTNDVLAQCPTRAQFKEIFTRLYNYPKFGTPFKRGQRCVDWVCVTHSHQHPRYYYFHNSGLQAQSVLYSAPDPASEGDVFFDPNTLSDDGTVRTMMS